MRPNHKFKTFIERSKDLIAIITTIMVVLIKFLFQLMGTLIVAGVVALGTHQMLEGKINMFCLTSYVMHVYIHSGLLILQPS